MRNDSRQDEQIKPDPARKGQSELERSRGGDAGRGTEPSDVRNANDQADDQDIDTAGTDGDQTSDVDSDRVSAGKPRPGGSHNR